MLDRGDFVGNSDVIKMLLDKSDEAKLMKLSDTYEVELLLLKFFQLLTKLIDYAPPSFWDEDDRGCVFGRSFFRGR